MPLILGVVDICRSKAHLKSDNRCAEFDGGKNQSGDKTQEKTKENLGENQQEEGQRREIHLGNRFGHYREEHQRADKNQGCFHPPGGLGRNKHWNADHESGNPGGYNQEGLDLVNGKKRNFHGTELKGDHAFKETSSKNTEKLDQPWPEKQYSEKDSDYLWHEGKRLLVDLGGCLENGNQQADDQADNKHGGRPK